LKLGSKKERLGKEGILGTTHHKRSKLQRLLSSKEKMTETSTLSGTLVQGREMTAVISSF